MGTTKGRSLSSPSRRGSLVRQGRARHTGFSMFAQHSTALHGSAILHVSSTTANDNADDFMRTWFISGRAYRIWMAGTGGSIDRY